jgi:hypothetical protein
MAQPRRPLELGDSDKEITRGRNIHRPFKMTVNVYKPGFRSAIVRNHEIDASIQSAQL